MKIRTKTVLRLTLCGVAGLAVAISASHSMAQESEEGRRRGRAEAREGDPPAERGGPRGRRGEQAERGDQAGPRGGFGGPGGPGPEMLLRLPVIAALDADKDGVISKEEIAGASAALKTLDKNKDGKIDLAEMVPSRGGPGGRGFGDRGPGGPAGPGGRGPRDGDAGRGPGPGDAAEGRGPGGRGPGGFGDPKAMLDRLMTQDKDGDGLLAADELPERMAAMLDGADSNEDGKLSREEIQKAMQARMANMRRGGGGRPGGDRPGAGRGGDTPGGERPRRPPAE